MKKKMAERVKLDGIRVPTDGTMDWEKTIVAIVPRRGRFGARLLIVFQDGRGGLNWIESSRCRLGLYRANMALTLELNTRVFV